MPARQPFTALCQRLAQGRHIGRADLHLHTTCSDGTYTPAQIVELARRCGLSALAITDHDTLAALPAARAAAGADVEVIAGVEISSEYQGRELHLLAYFVDAGNPALQTALADVREHRAARFGEMIERLRSCGVSVDDEGARPDALGRRHLAELMVKQGRVGSVREAFSRYLSDGGSVVVPKKRLPAEEALGLVRDAGGVAAWAHPAYDCTRGALTELRAFGLGAVEAEYPDMRRVRSLELRAWAAGLGLAVSGGSDCHGPGRRSVGACTISPEELDRLRQQVER